jgi:hypothetical protein
MSLLFQPETAAQLKRRFIAALTPVYTPELIRSNHPKPNEQRQHLFDFEDGTRLCITHEQLGQRLYLHVTGSMDRRCQIRSTNFANVCFVKLCELSGRSLRVFQTDTESLSIHLLCEPITEALVAAVSEGAGQHATSPLSPQRDQV